MKQTLKACLQGGSLSWLYHTCDDSFVSFLMEKGLLRRCAGRACAVVKDKQVLSVVEEESEARFYAEGFLSGVWSRIPLSSADVQRYCLDLKAFLQAALDLGVFGVSLKTLNILRDGCHAYRICQLPAFNVTLYFTLNNTDTEYELIEKDCGTFSRQVVIISPEYDPPKSFRSVIGNCQNIALDDMFADGGETEPAPLSAQVRWYNPKPIPPYSVMPGLNPNEVEWSDISIHFTLDHKIIIGCKGKKKTFLREHVYFTRSAANTPNYELKQTYMLLCFAYFQRWSITNKTLQKEYQRLNREMQIFFRQSTPFYKKGEDGLSHPLLSLSLDESLAEHFQEVLSELADEVESSGLRKFERGGGITDWDALEAVTNKLLSK